MPQQLFLSCGNASMGSFHKILFIMSVHMIVVIITLTEQPSVYIVVELIPPNQGILSIISVQSLNLSKLSITCLGLDDWYSLNGSTPEPDSFTDEDHEMCWKAQLYIILPLNLLSYGTLLC